MGLGKWRCKGYPGLRWWFVGVLGYLGGARVVSCVWCLVWSVLLCVFGVAPLGAVLCLWGCFFFLLFFLISFPPFSLFFLAAVSSGSGVGKGCLQVGLVGGVWGFCPVSLWSCWVLVCVVCLPSVLVAFSFRGFFCSCLAAFLWETPGFWPLCQLPWREGKEVSILLCAE